MSVFRTSGIRWVAKIHSSAGRKFPAIVLGPISTLGYFEQASRTAKTISSVGKGLQKSAEASSHGPFGVGDIFRGSHCEVLMLAVHLKKLCMPHEKS